jgi:hypothetical protein
MHGLKIADGEPQIGIERAGVDMAQQVLDLDGMGPPAEQMSGAGAPQRMGGDRGQASIPRVGPDGCCGFAVSPSAG